MAISELEAYCSRSCRSIRVARSFQPRIRRNVESGVLRMLRPTGYWPCRTGYRSLQGGRRACERGGSWKASFAFISAYESTRRRIGREGIGDTFCRHRFADENHRLPQPRGYGIC